MPGTGTPSWHAQIAGHHRQDGAPPRRAPDSSPAWRPGLHPGVPVTAGVVVVAGIIVGLLLGWCATMVITLAVVSRSQERMQRKVRYWQAETARAQAEADRLAGAAASRKMPPGPDREPWVW
jgi:hypothetical protein